MVYNACAQCAVSHALYSVRTTRVAGTATTGAFLMRLGRRRTDEGAGGAGVPRLATTTLLLLDVEAAAAARTAKLDMNCCASVPLIALCYLLLIIHTDARACRQGRYS